MAENQKPIVVFKGVHIILDFNHVPGAMVQYLQKSFTATGTTRTPDKLLDLQWVNKAWDSGTAEMIVNFKFCSISVEKDGSDDDLIHAIKPGSLVDNAGGTPGTHCCAHAFNFKKSQMFNSEKFRKMGYPGNFPCNGDVQPQ